jgi:hypothetical protein
MRALLVILILLLPCMASCEDRRLPSFDQLRLGAPGLTVSVDRWGNGQFRRETDALGANTGKAGTFKLSSDALMQLRQRLEPFRLSGETLGRAEFEKKAIGRMALRWRVFVRCRRHNSQWTGPDYEQFYNVDFGCEAPKHSERNKELAAALASLPVPEPLSLP